MGIVAKYNFAPTEMSRQNLLNEGKKEESIFVTGNTAIDALKTTVREDYSHPELEWASDSRLIMLTAHRRENLGEPMHHMFRAIRRIIDEHLSNSYESSCKRSSKTRIRGLQTSTYY